jgi:peroxiredoxin
MGNTEKPSLFGYLPTIVVLVALAFQSAVGLQVLREIRGLSGLLREVVATKRAAPASGLQAGAPASAFQLTDSEGTQRSLEDYQGRKTLLVFSSPTCSFCTEMYPRLGKLAEGEDGAGVQVLLLQRDSTPRQNEELKSRYELGFPVLAATDEIFQQYQVPGTPFAVLVDERGAVVRSRPGSSYESLRAVVVGS